MALDATLLTALGGQALRSFYAIEIDLNGGSPIYLMDGSGTVTFGGKTFVSNHATAGSLINVSAVEESLATQAPQVHITVSPPTTSSLATLGAVNAQGSPVYIWFGLIDPSLGTVIGNPELLFSGQLDSMKITASANSRVAELSVASVWERLFIPSEGERLNQTWQTSVWPGDTGLSQAVNSVVVNPTWGAYAITPNTTPGLTTPGFTGGTIPGAVTYNGSGGGYPINLGPYSLF